MLIKDKRIIKVETGPEGVKFTYIITGLTLTIIISRTNNLF